MAVTSPPPPPQPAPVPAGSSRAEVFATVRERDDSFLDGVLAGMFTVPGDAGLDFGPVMRSLADIGYAGWIVVEAEQDPAVADPRVYGELGLRTLRREALAAGLVEAS